MKYEKPIAEIRILGASDVLATSGGGAGGGGETTEPAVTTTKKSQPNTIVGDEGGVCSYTKADNYNFDNCL